MFSRCIHTAFSGLADMRSARPEVCRLRLVQLACVRDRKAHIQRRILTKCAIMRAMIGAWDMQFCTEAQQN